MPRGSSSGEWMGQSSSCQERERERQRQTEREKEEEGELKSPPRQKLTLSLSVVLKQLHIRKEGKVFSFLVLPDSR